MFVQILPLTQGKLLIRTGIGRTQPALDGRHTCTVCILFQSVLGPHRDYVPLVKVVPIRTETVRKRTEAVRKRYKYGVRLEQAGSILCPCCMAVSHSLFLLLVVSLHFHFA